MTVGGITTSTLVDDGGYFPEFTCSNFSPISHPHQLSNPSLRLRHLPHPSLSLHHLSNPSLTLHHLPHPSLRLHHLPHPSLSLHHLSNPSPILHHLPHPSLRLRQLPHQHPNHQSTGTSTLHCISVTNNRSMMENS